jgi:hypothetical protein
VFRYECGIGLIKWLPIQQGENSGSMADQSGRIITIEIYVFGNIEHLFDVVDVSSPKGRGHIEFSRVLEIPEL